MTLIEPICLKDWPAGSETNWHTMDDPVYAQAQWREGDWDTVENIIERFGQWAVTRYGLECQTKDYSIYKQRLWEQDWEKHVAAKRWVNTAEFGAALDAARKIHARFNPTHQRSRRVIVSGRRRFLILKRDDYKCCLCGRKASDGAELEIDHKIPAARGGDNTLQNLWTLCRECNQGKSDLSL